MPEPKNTMEMFADQNAQLHGEPTGADDAKSDGTATPTSGKVDKGKGKEVVSDSPTALSPAKGLNDLPVLSVSIPEEKKPITDIRLGNEASLSTLR